jgi:hypothetical protein
MLNHLVAARGIRFNGPEIRKRWKWAVRRGDLELLNRLTAGQPQQPHLEDRKVACSRV